MPQSAVDYDALAREFGGAPVGPRPSTDEPREAAGVDYDALASEFGGTPVQAPDIRSENEKDAQGAAVVRDRPPGLATIGEQLLAKTADGVIDLGIGVGKGLTSSVIGAGELMRSIPGIGHAITKINEAIYDLTPEQQDIAFAEARKATEASNTMQAIGRGAEQVAEVVLPGGAVGRAATAASARLAPALSRVIGKTAAQIVPKAAVEGVAAGVESKIQGGDPLTSATVASAIPVVGAATRAAAPWLKDTAQKKVFQALDPRKERFKAVTEKIAPEVLARRIGGSREAIQAQAQEMVETVGEQIDDAITKYGSREVGTQPIVDALEQSKAPFQTVRTMTPAQAMRDGLVSDDGGRLVFKAGATLGDDGMVKIAVQHEPRAIRQLNQLQNIIEDLGDNARVDQLVGIRRTWDKVVADAGGFAHRAPGAIGVPLKDQSEAAAKREATTAIRQLLNESVPELGKLNKEYAFWRNLDQVVTQTLQRTQPHGKGVGRIAAETAGRVVGGAIGSTQGPAGAVTGAVLLGKAADIAKQMFTSPRWRMVDAKTRDQLAEAIASGRQDYIAATLGRITATQGSKLVPKENR